MSWFYFEWNEKDDEFVRNAMANKGKFVKVFDGDTGDELSKEQIQEIEEQRAEGWFPMILPEDIPKHEARSLKKKLSNKAIEKTIETEQPKGKGKKGRKWTSRIGIHHSLRKAIYELHDRKCTECGKEEANQIHHKDKNSSNNNIHNLQLLCYDCHLKKHKRKVIERE